MSVYALLLGKLVAILAAPAAGESLPVGDDAVAPVEIIAPELHDDEPAGVDIHGKIRHAYEDAPIVGVQVVLDCSCLARAREQRTDEQGRYRFTDLPAGVFFVRVIAGLSDITKVVEIPAYVHFVADFSIDPETDTTRRIVVDASGLSEEARAMPVGEPDRCNSTCRQAKRAERRHERNLRRAQRRNRGERSCGCQPWWNCPV